jgi:hypothetical protein
MKSSRVRLPRFYRNSCEFILRSIPDTGNWISRTDRRPTSEWRIFTGQWIKWRRSCIGTVGNCSRAGSLELFSFRLILLYTVNNGNALVSRGLKHSLKGLLLSFTERLICAQIRCTMIPDDVRTPLRAAGSERAPINRLSASLRNNRESD